MVQLKEAGVSVRCWGTHGDHRWCLLCRHNNGVLDVKQLLQMRDACLQRRLDGKAETLEDQRELANITEALLLLKAS